MLKEMGGGDSEGGGTLVSTVTGGSGTTPVSCGG